MEKKIVENIKLGSDPEVFLVDSTEKLISGIGLIGGSKYDPLYVGDNIFLQEDNVAVEFSFNPPAENAFEFVEAIINGLNKINEKVSEHGLKYKIMSSGVFEDDQLLHPDALLFGCDPDFNVWTEQQNLPAQPDAIGGLRSCGGHVHVGYNNPNVKTSFDIIKAMDLFLGVPSVLFDKDLKRRELYGKAGCFRIKKYGVEYRTLSNFWAASPDLIRWVYDQTMKAIDFVNESQSYLCDNYAEQIQQAINSSDSAIAEKLIKEFNLTEVPVCVV